MIYHVFSSEKADGSYEIGGTEGVYTHPEPNKEHLIVYGPIMEDITLYVSSLRKKNKGVIYILIYKCCVSDHLNYVCHIAQLSKFNYVSIHTSASMPLISGYGSRLV